MLGDKLIIHNYGMSGLGSITQSSGEVLMRSMCTGASGAGYQASWYVTSTTLRYLGEKEKLILNRGMAKEAVHLLQETVSSSLLDRAKL